MDTEFIVAFNGEFLKRDRRQRVDLIEIDIRKRGAIEVAQLPFGTHIAIAVKVRVDSADISKIYDSYEL